MLAEIIPVTRLPSRIKSFTYAVPEEISGEIMIGQAIEVPFRNKNIMGIVLAIKKDEIAKFKLKPIAKIISPLPFMNARELALANWLADYYHLSPGMMLKTILPAIPKRKFKAKEVREILLKTPEELTEEEEKTLQKIKASIKKSIVFSPSKKETKNNTYLGLIQEAQKNKKQILLIVPEMKDLDELTSFFGQYLDQNQIAILHGGLAKNAYYSAWMKAKNGEASLIIGTRPAIFAPTKDLGLIIIDKEHDQSHKQWDMNPRYHVREVAQRIQATTGVKILFTSTAPSVEVMSEVTAGNYELLKTADSSAPQIKLVDMRDEIKKQNYSPFSELLQEAIKETLEKKQQIFLFINRRGTASSVLCRDCGFVFKCPNCKLPLSYHGASELRCHNCAYKNPLPLFCPQCHGPEIKFSGAGTEKIEKEIKKLNPIAKILRLDIETEEAIKAEHKSYTAEADIIIGTQYALKFIDWEKIELAGIVSADTLLYLPDFRSGEKTYQLFSEIIFELGSKEKEIIIQTRKPDNLALQALGRNNPELFYNQEIEERKIFHYPPFGKIVKLLYQHGNEKKCIYESNRVWQELNKKIMVDKNIEMSLPAPIHNLKVRGRFRYQIILKVPLELGDKLGDLLNIVPDDWIIDINPESLL